MSDLRETPGLRLVHAACGGGGPASPLSVVNTRIPVGSSGTCKHSHGPQLVHTGHSLHGRRHGRLRQKQLRRTAYNLGDPAQMRIGTLNVQGWNWRLHRQVHNTIGVVDAARSQAWDVLCLSDMHEFENDRSERPRMLRLEEFTLIAYRRVGILLGPRVRAHAKEITLGEYSERDVAVNIKWFEVTLKVVSVYAPVQGDAARPAFWARIGKLLDEMPEGVTPLVGGDWNAHVGKDYLASDHAMAQPTTRGGMEMVRFLSARQKYTRVDGKCRITSRGTWKHVQSGNWYELDYYISTPAVKKMVQKVTTMAMPFTDHMGKNLLLHLRLNKQRHKKRAGMKQEMARKHDESELKPYRTSLLKGPSPGAKEKRDLFEKRVGEELNKAATAQNKKVQMPAEDSRWLRWTEICTDGTGGDGGRMQAGWGIAMREATRLDQGVIRFTEWEPGRDHIDGVGTVFGPVQLREDAVNYMGATKKSNNTGELSAILVAMKWILKRPRPHKNFLIRYDSQYAANMTTGVWSPQANTALVHRNQLAYRAVREVAQIKMQWVKGHSGDEGNEKADKAADMGGLGLERWPRDFDPAVRAEPVGDEGDPDVTWDETVELLHRVLDEVVGRGSEKGYFVPYTDDDYRIMKEMQEDCKQKYERVRQLQGRKEEGTSRQALKESKRKLDRFKRRARNSYVRQVCKELERAMHHHDMGRFHLLLRKLGVATSGVTGRKTQHHTAEEAAARMKKIGNEAYDRPETLDENYQSKGQSTRPWRKHRRWKKLWLSWRA